MGSAVSKRVIVSAFLAIVWPQLAPTAFADNQGFSSWNVQILYGWTFQEPGIAVGVPKNVLTFENTAAGRWWSSYLFVDVLRSWSEADADASEVYGEWYPSLSLRKISGRAPAKGFVRDVSATLGLNAGVRSTGPSPFVLLPGVTVDLNVRGFTFLSVGGYAFVDRSRFQGQPTECQATTYQITPSWSLPFDIGGATLRFDGFTDFIGSRANCAATILSQPQLKLDLSELWGKPGQIYVGVEWAYWHNKYGISGLEDKVFLPAFVWVM